MIRRQPIVATVVAICLSLSASFNPAFANGLIPTERIVTTEAASNLKSITGQPGATDSQLERASVAAILVNAGVDPTQAQARVDALTDAEIAQLSQNIANAPAGGLWFMPFLLVAAVIGLLIGTRETSAGSNPTNTNLFGHPRTIANSP